MANSHPPTRSFVIVLTALVLVTLFSACSFVFAYAATNSVELTVVASEGVVLRSSPEGKVIGSLKQNDIITITARTLDGSWGYTDPDGLLDFVGNQWVTLSLSAVEYDRDQVKNLPILSQSVKGERVVESRYTDSIGGGKSANLYGGAVVNKFGNLSWFGVPNFQDLAKIPSDRDDIVVKAASGQSCAYVDGQTDVNTGKEFHVIDETVDVTVPAGITFVVKSGQCVLTTSGAEIELQTLRREFRTVRPSSLGSYGIAMAAIVITAFLAIRRRRQLKYASVISLFVLFLAASAEASNQLVPPPPGTPVPTEEASPTEEPEVTPEPNTGNPTGTIRVDKTEVQLKDVVTITMVGAGFEPDTILFVVSFELETLIVGPVEGCPVGEDGSFDCAFAWIVDTDYVGEAIFNITLSSGEPVENATITGASITILSIEEPVAQIYPMTILAVVNPDGSVVVVLECPDELTGDQCGTAKTQLYEDLQGQPGTSVKLEVIVAALLANEDFLAKTKGTDGVSPKLEDIVATLLANEDFLAKAKGTDAIGIESAAMVNNHLLIYLANGKTIDVGEVESGPQGQPGKDAKLSMFGAMWLFGGGLLAILATAMAGFALLRSARKDPDQGPPPAQGTGLTGLRPQDES